MKRPVGRAAATRKYDLLTVLTAFALSQDKHQQRRALRLIGLITARYNWQSDQLSCGQAEIARLWSVDTRTVKREIAALRACGWLVEKRSAARGRVTLHGLGIEKILMDTRPVWENVGPDLVARLTGMDDLPAPAEAETRVIPFPAGKAGRPGEDTPVWGRISQMLEARDPGIWRAWYAALVADEGAEVLFLHAPSDFHATYVATHLLRPLEMALSMVAPGMGLRILGRG